MLARTSDSSKLPCGLPMAQYFSQTDPVTCQRTMKYLIFGLSDEEDEDFMPVSPVMDCL